MSRLAGFTLAPCWAVAYSGHITRVFQGPALTEPEKKQQKQEHIQRGLGPGGFQLSVKLWLRDGMPYADSEADFF